MLAHGFAPNLKKTLSRNLGLVMYCDCLLCFRCISPSNKNLLAACQSTKSFCTWVQRTCSGSLLPCPASFSLLMNVVTFFYSSYFHYTFIAQNYILLWGIRGYPLTRLQSDIATPCLRSSEIVKCSPLCPTCHVSKFIHAFANNAFKFLSQVL